MGNVMEISRWYDAAENSALSHVNRPILQTEMQYKIIDNKKMEEPVVLVHNIKKLISSTWSGKLFKRTYFVPRRLYQPRLTDREADII